MTLPRRHTWNCLHFGNDADCVECHPQPLCKNCGHTANQHSYSDELATLGWCPGCRGCGPRSQQEERTTVMRRMSIFLTNGQTHTLNLKEEEEDYLTKKFAEAMDRKLTLTFKSEEGATMAFNGTYIMFFKVED